MLFLFDIDGTLVSGASREHATALRKALENVHGVDVGGLRPNISPAGRTDGEIARLLRREGLLEEGTDIARKYRHRADPSKIISRSVWRKGMETAEDLLTEIPNED